VIPYTIPARGMPRTQWINNARRVGRIQLRPGRVLLDWAYGDGPLTVRRVRREVDPWLVARNLNLIDQRNFRERRRKAL